MLCLSHWPGIGTPPEFAADLSAEMAFVYLDAFDRHGDAAAVSNNHFDQDGLVGLFALVAPADALPRRELLVEVARAGDFAVTDLAGTRRPHLHGALGLRRPRAQPAACPARRLRRPDGVLCTASCSGVCPSCATAPSAPGDLWAEEDATLDGERGRPGIGQRSRSPRCPTSTSPW